MKPRDCVPLKLVPVSLREAQRFIGTHHRHNMAPKRYKFAVAVADKSGALVGVAAAAQPIARLLDDGQTIEIIRSCTDGTPNANSMLYGAIVRAAKALGYKKAITYTLESESGASLRAVGWEIEKDSSPAQQWNRPNRHRCETDLFGTRRPPPENRVRWGKAL